MKTPTYTDAIYNVALHIVGMAPDNADLYLRHGAVDISLIYGTDRPTTLNDLEAKYKELNEKWESKLVISVREED